MSVIHSDIFPCPVAEHELITVTIDLREPKRSPTLKSFREIRNYSPNILCDLLMEESYRLNQILATDDIDRQVSIFTETFNKCINECAPVVTREIKRPFVKWISEELRKLMQERNSVLKVDRNNTNLRDKYKSLKKKVRNLLHKTKNEYYNKEIQDDKGDSAATWKILRESIPAPQRKMCATVDAEETDDKADAFNRLFANVGKETFMKSQLELQKDQPECITTNENYNDNLCNFRPQPTDSSTIILAIKHLKNSNSYGCDGISLRF